LKVKEAKNMRRSEEQYPMRRERGSELMRPGSFMEPFGFGGSPWQMMRRMQEDMDRVFGQFFGPTGTVAATQPGAMQQWAPSMDISSTDKEICLEAELPGVNKDDIDVTVQDRHLILRAEMRQEKEGDPGAPGERQYHRRERRYGMFERVIPLPDDVNEDQIQCDFRNGVLTVHVPRSQQQKPVGRRIEVKDASQIPSETAAGRSRSQAELEMTEEEEEGAGQEMAGSSRTAR
jgi:HSP20 family protein